MKKNRYTCIYYFFTKKIKVKSFKYYNGTF